ncbi:metallophosphoesterase family protein [Treponema sp.]|uniref:metallophosphoesterase family protein n=1 Tax=Treponema sp. TaxID=166 RepID=UPI0025ED0900|nr:metallophosphoesterase family protein [Treponema sp.]MCR5217422.1 metallophosphoesterase family protein [Treponema sp.]
MKFLVISDLHGNLEILDKMDVQFKEADAVLFAGDFTKFKFPETGAPALEKLCKKHDIIYSVIGNCDEPDFLSQIEAADISVEKTLVNHEGLCFAGSGGGSKFTGDTPNERSDEELVSDFDIITKQGKAEWNNLIAIMHNPPKDTECDKVAADVHVGSPLLRQFIDDYQPLAVITGHIHESAGISKAGNTTIVNPGALTDGKYAVLEVEKNNDRWTVTNCVLKSL